MHSDAPIFTGALPNIYHHALTFDHLRHLPTFTALPAVESICISGPSSYRYIRQDDDLWGRLHVGRLTSGYLSAALGLFEPTAGKRLRLSKSRISHGHLLNAYRHLSQQPYHPSINENITEESAALHNARITAEFNKNKINSTASALNGGGSGGGGGADKLAEREGELAVESAAGAGDGPNKKKNRRKKKQNAHQNVATAGTANAATTAATTTATAIKLARAVGSQGIDAVRCSWGTIQESTTLHVLGTGVFPKSEIIEAGLFMLNESVLPKSWNFLPGELPPIGSSPDALAQHPPSCHNSSGSGSGGGDGVDNNSNILEEDEEKAADALSELLMLSNLSLNDSSQPILEVVEVKNTCPFDYSQQVKHGGGGGGSRGSKKKKFVVCDRGPRHQLDVLWIPQLQLHMLCTQTSSSLLVSRSATRGLRVFRVAADPEFQRAMLCVLRKLYTEHVQPQNMPRKDVFEHMPEHDQLLKRIRQIVNNAEVVAEISGEEAVAVLSRSLSSFESNGNFKLDSRFFLD